jgi:hypothetical protein
VASFWAVATTSDSSVVDTFAVLAAVDLGIPDLLANGPRAVGDLAEHIGAHPLSLHRLMRALASRNVVREEVDERFSLTGLGAPAGWQRTRQPAARGAMEGI